MIDRAEIERVPSSQDYELLRSEALLQIEKLGRRLWTDYNVHDPGITLLELLCYGITDLGYRAGHGIADILSGTTEDGKVAVRGTFHSARQVLSCAPVSFRDLRMLLIDVTGVRNAWIVPHCSVRYCVDLTKKRLVDGPPALPQVESNAPLDGLFDVLIELEDFVRREPSGAGEQELRRDALGRPLLDPINVSRSEVELAVRERLHRYRGLCQDFVEICDLGVEEVAICADVAVAPDADLEQVLAEVFHRLGAHVSPAVRFHTIDDLRARGRSTDEIFEGPPLEHGFIDVPELERAQRRCEIRTSDVVQILMGVSGVVAVKSVLLLGYLGGERRAQEKWVLPLSTDVPRVPEFRPDLSKILFYKNDLPHLANRAEVERLLAEKKAVDARAKLSLREEQRDLPIPVGEPRQIADYYPLQNELPATYAVGQYRVAKSAPDERKAQALQLRAYLMLFEQILSNHVAQLDNLWRLFSWQDEGNATYFTQPVAGSTEAEKAELARVLVPAEDELAAKLREIVEVAAGRSAQERKSQFLEHLLARFGETLTAYGQLMRSLQVESARPRFIADQRRFLAGYPRIGQERGTGYDYRYPQHAANVSGYQRRVCALLGIADATRRRLSGTQFTIEPAVGEPGYRFVLEASTGERLFESIPCEAESEIEALLDTALEIGGDDRNWEKRADGDAYELVLRCGDAKRVLGAPTSTDLETREEVRRTFKSVGNAEGFHVVEHVLLRKRTAGDPFLPIQVGGTGECDCDDARDPYSFRMTVVLPAWAGRFRRMRFRRFVEDTLRAEAPAHIHPRVCWISHAQMAAFEKDYCAWAAELAALEAKRKAGEELGGAVPLPPTTEHGHEQYRQSLERLIERLRSLVNVYPVARLYDCEETQGDAPQVSLGNTSLGTL